jgi:electron transport complex protein RnfG
MSTLNFRHLFILLALSASAVGLLFSTHALLRERIASNQRDAALQPLLAVFPQSLQAHVRLENAGELSDSELLGLRSVSSLYRAYVDNNLIGWVVPAIARDGYGGDITLVIALNTQAEIIGVQVLNHRETAGMGDRIERRHSDWLDTFNQHSLRYPTQGSWYVRKDGGVFDQMTGATITSRAVTKAVKQTLEYYSAHQDKWTATVPAANTDAEPAHE